MPLVVVLAGCGAERAADLGETAGVASISGTVHGGQQVISGATIGLYAAGSAGNGKGAVNLLTRTVVTDGNGQFSLTGDYTCPGGSTQVYLVGSGGNPGLALPTNNGAIVLMAALGDCGNLQPTTYVTMNEVTTAAAVWALQQFMGAGGVVGASGTNANGLRNAFLAAGNLADTQSGASPGLTMPAGAVMETAKLYTLADALAGCVSSDGTTGCLPLFTAATNGSTPTNTLDAALAIVRNPAVHLQDVLNAAGTVGPFQPTLTSAPNDWMMSVDYVGGGMDLPTALAVDDVGDVWMANYFGGAVSEFTTAGAAVATSGFPASTVESYGLTIDGNHQIWVANEQTPYVINRSDGSLNVVSQGTGQVISGYGYAGGGVFFPVAMAADASGRIWVADYGDGHATLLNNDGSGVTGSPFSGPGIPFPLAVAVDGNQNAWFAVQGGAAQVTPAGGTVMYSCCSNPSGVAIDQGGNVWLADYGAARVVEMSGTGVVESAPASVGGLNHPQGIAVDGSGTVWVTNYRGESVTEISGYGSASPGTVISPGNGFGLAAGMIEPFAIALDASGNAWISNTGNNTLTELVGIASPVKTPLLGPPVAP